MDEFTLIFFDTFYIKHLDIKIAFKNKNIIKHLQHMININ